MERDENGFVIVNEELCKSVRLVSSRDAELVYEAIEHTKEELAELMSLLRNEMLRESARPTLCVAPDSQIRRNIMREAQKLERLMILEAVSAKDFFTVQKHFRSMVRAASVIGNWLKGSTLAARMDSLKTEGIELLNTLYDHVKDLEGNELSQLSAVDKHAMKSDEGTTQLRDRFVKVFTDFAVLFRGTMALADMFSDDPAQLGGYNDVKSVVSSLEREDMTGEPLGQALAYLDHTAPDISPKKGFFGKFASKKAGLTGTLKNAIMKAVSSSSPGFAKAANINELVEYLMSKSADQLMAIFGRFNDFVAADVDVDYLLSVAKNPRTLGSIFKSIFDTLGSAGSFGVRTR